MIVGMLITVLSSISITYSHVVQNANDFEMYSSNSAGAIQGFGYQARNAGYALSHLCCVQTTY